MITPAKVKLRRETIRVGDSNVIQNGCDHAPALRFRAVTGGLVGDFHHFHPHPGHGENHFPRCQNLATIRTSHMLGAAVCNPEFLLWVDDKGDGNLSLGATLGQECPEPRQQQFCITDLQAIRASLAALF